MARRSRRGKRAKRLPNYYVGIDGEGQGKDIHRYVMLAYADERGVMKRQIEAPEGGRLSTRECLDFILGMPLNCKAFAFAFNYDLTKILTDVDDKILYLLFRPELRKDDTGWGFQGPRALNWQGYSINLVGSKFTVTGKINGSSSLRTRVIWDVFKFFQAKFTSALTDWKVGEAAAVARMQLMKERRHEFDKLTRKEILDYCHEECQYMATLARKLKDAHTEAGLDLKVFHGAGSTAGAMLKLCGVKEHPRETPKPMKEAVACAFFGGRFENSVIGPVEGPIWSYDISSAYPYGATFLPCLACGTWEHTTLRSDLDDPNVRSACVRYCLRKQFGYKDQPWGPFPFRIGKGDEKGSIVFPSASGGGWIWKDEYIAGERLFPNAVQFKEAWVYRCDCDHKIFDQIPTWYLERLRIGKEGPGIVIKLGLNSCYGKMAQSIGGDPPFQCWIWAGMITSGCRAQQLDVMYVMQEHGIDLRHLLMIATDGIGVSKRLNLWMPKPRHTGTQNAVNEKGERVNKPLGGWEEKDVPKGMFLARPGIYFPLNPTDDEIKFVRARGVGRAAMYERWRELTEAYARGEKGVVFGGHRRADGTIQPDPDSPMSRFFGAKSSISRGIVRNRETQKIVGYTYKRAPRYGQWATRPIEMNFDPLPKREGVRKDGTLRIRSFPMDLESARYKKGEVSDETLMMQAAEAEVIENPDGDVMALYG